MVARRGTHLFLLASTFLFAVHLTAQTTSFELSRNGNTLSNSFTLVQEDFNNDGKPDIAFTGNSGVNSPSPNQVNVRLGNGDGTFQPQTEVGPVNTNDILAMVAADIDQDGNLDLVVPEIGAFAVFYGNGDGTFQPPVTVSTFGGGYVAVGHFFGDPWLDVAIGGGFNPGKVELFQNSGGRAFTPANTIPVGSGSNEELIQLKSGNLDGSGADSMAVLTNFGAYVLWGQNDGTFQMAQLASYVAPVDLNVANLDQDGIDDVLVSYTCNPTPTNSPKGPTYVPCQGIDVFYGQGNQNVIQRTVVTDPNDGAGASLWGVDVNGDGIGDLVLASGTATTSMDGLFVYIGNPDGSFSQTPQTFIVSTSGAGPIVPGDWNRDGAIDFAMIASSEGQQQIFINGGSRASCSNSLINDSVTVCTPSNYAYLPSPVTVQANTTDNNTVTATQEYIDDQLVYSADQPSFTQSFDLAPGRHFLVTKAWDDTGLSFRSDRTITIYNGTPYPSCPAAPNSANICLPSGATSSSPVHILANGYAPTVPTAAQLYIDGNLVINDEGCTSGPTGNSCGGGTSYVDTMQSLSSGDHDLVFKVWDANGNVDEAEKMITVE